ncbi:MAG: zinc ABC transporter substrate-binding protein [Candidatus Competibacteraceae bacterium]
MNLLSLLYSLSLIMLACLSPPGVAAPGPDVVASIKPVHSLVAGVMQGVGEPVLLLKGGASPHDYSLRPSEVQRIDQAQVVFWIGSELESFLSKSLDNATGVRSIELLRAPGVETLPLREGGAWEPHGHDRDEHEHTSGDADAHIWLDPRNAMAMVRWIGTVLGEVDPAHKAVYASNAAALLERLAQLERNLREQLQPLQGKPYIVFHDAYHYFERRFGLAAVGSITLNPERPVGARRIQEIRERIKNNQVLCVFSEPQFKPTLVDTLIEDSPAKRGVLDELGADLTAGPEAYFQLMHHLADGLRACLGT